MQLSFSKVKKKNSVHGILSHLKFLTIKVALSPTHRIFLNFAKSCVLSVLLIKIQNCMLSCLSKFDNKKKIHQTVFEI